VAEQRYHAVLEVLDAVPIVEVAERYGVSRQSVHAWVRRYQAGGLEGLADRSHRPASCPHQLPVGIAARVCELRRQHPGWGSQRLRTSWVGVGWSRCRRPRVSIGPWSGPA
jgi:transposase